MEYLFGELFFGCLDFVEIIVDNGGIGVVDLMKNMNKIEVCVKGIVDGLLVCIIFDNGCFNLENVMLVDVGMIIYVFYYSVF